MSKLKNIWEKVGIYGILAVIQYLAAVFFNFKYTAAAVDPDSAKLFRHAMEMSKNHAIYIPNWSNATTMEWDSAAILAAPFYTLTHNIYVAFAIANSIILLYVLFLVFYLFRQFEISEKNIMKAYNLFLIPYAFGMLDYFNMLFFNGSQYIFRIIMPLTLLIIVSTPRAKRLRPMNIFFCIIEAASFLVAASSSGTYILVSCAMPLLVVLIYDAIMSDSFKKYDLYQYIVCVTALVLSGIGMMLNKSIGGGEIGNSMSLLRWYDWRYYADCFVEGFFRLMGAMPGAIEGESVAVMSLRGFAFLFKLLIAMIILIVMIVVLKQTVFTGKDKTKENDPRANNIRYFLCGIAFINLIMLMVCETRYSSLNSTLECRYLLPVVVPIIFIIPIQLEIWEKSYSEYLKKIVNVVFVVGILFVTLMCYRDAHDGLDAYAYCDQITEYVAGTDYEDVIFLDDRVTAECCRLKDPSREYEAYSSEGFMNIVDYYLDASYSSFYNGHHLLFAIGGTNVEEKIGPERAAAYSYRETFLWFDVYSAETFVLGNDQ